MIEIEENEIYYICNKKWNVTSCPFPFIYHNSTQGKSLNEIYEAAKLPSYSQFHF